jgi:aspartate aminotransferase
VVLNVVKKAEAILAADASLNHEYLDIAGDAKFVELSRAILFGQNSEAIKEKRVVSAQSLSGTGALRLGSEFIARSVTRTGNTHSTDARTWNIRWH